jgi:hypothetical protein
VRVKKAYKGACMKSFLMESKIELFSPQTSSNSLRKCGHLL